MGCTVAPALRSSTMKWGCFPSELAGIYGHLRHRAAPPYTYIGDMVKDWSGLCRLLTENNLDTKHYMRWIWNFYTLHRPIAYINMITSPKSVKIYMDQAPYKEEDRESELRLKLDIQKDVVLTEMTCGRHLQEILHDESLAIGAVMRYVLAISGGLV